MYTMIFRAPGPHKIHGFNVEYQTVADALVPQFLDEGWTTTAIEAGERHAAAVIEQAQAERVAQEHAVADELASKPPTREELEQKAQELGLTYGPKVSDRKLREMVDAAVKQDA